MGLKMYQKAPRRHQRDRKNEVEKGHKKVKKKFLWLWSGYANILEVADSCEKSFDHGLPNDIFL